jgi:tetratricopeptide (TPR) repeat protein
VALLAARQRCNGVDRDAYARVAQWCDRLPLALRIAGCRLDPTAHFGVDQLAEALADEYTRLDQLATEAGELSIRAVFATWLRALDAPAIRVLALLGLHPGPRPSVQACAVLAGEPVPKVRAALEALATAHLLTPADADRFQVHDLVRLLAREQAATVLPAAEADAALTRLLVWYRDTADAVDRVLRPGERSNVPGVEPSTSFADEASAFAWLDAEVGNLVAAVEWAAETRPTLAWQIAAAMFGWLNRRHDRAQWVALYTVAADAANGAGDATGEATIVARLAIAYSQLGLSDEAISACRRAYRIRDVLGDQLGAATALLNLAAVHLNDGEADLAVHWLDKAAKIGSTVENADHFQAILHSNFGEAHRLAGRFPDASHHYQLALGMTERAGSVRDSAHVHLELGRLYRDVGEPAKALAYSDRALDLANRAHDALLSAEALECRGRVLAANGDVDAAVAALRAALDGYAGLGHRHTKHLADLVSRLEHR